jgi:hydroxymethylpyrimidine pyrophosphatase-like HAD family hydrolase
VLALDFDGTIAIDDRLDGPALAAVQQARDAGILVVLVTGRILSDLEAFFSGTPPFDAIVAENGAVLWLPATRAAVPLHESPEPRFLAELRRIGVAHRAGSCVVEAAADTGPRILEVIRRLSLPLGISFNRGRLMVLPLEVSKGSGLRLGLHWLRASSHNAVAIGDAENDRPLFEACEVGAAVPWGSEALKRAADEVIPEQPEAVARFVRELIAESTISPERLRRRFVRFGWRASGEPLDLGIRGRNLLVGGDPKSGKSWLTGLLCEQLILQGYSVCVLDPEGDYACLEALPGVIVQRASAANLPTLPLERLLAHPDLSLVLDLSDAAPADKPALVRHLLERINERRRATGLPHRVVIDEAHYFLGLVDDPEMLAPELGGYLLVTYRVADLSAQALGMTDAVIVTRVTDPRQVVALRRLAPQGGEAAAWADSLGDLAIDEACLLPGSPESGTAPIRFRIAPRLTPHVRHRQKYADVPVFPGREFVFTRGGLPTGERARTAGELLSLLPALPAEVFDGHLARGDFHRWFERVFGDRELGRAIRRLEGGDVSDPRQRMMRAIEERYLGAGASSDFPTSPFPG